MSWVWWCKACATCHWCQCKQVAARALLNPMQQKHFHQHEQEVKALVVAKPSTMCSSIHAYLMQIAENPSNLVKWSWHSQELAGTSWLQGGWVVWHATIHCPFWLKSNEKTGQHTVTQQWMKSGYSGLYLGALDNRILSRLFVLSVVNLSIVYWYLLSGWYNILLSIVSGDFILLSVAVPWNSAC